MVEGRGEPVDGFTSLVTVIPTSFVRWSSIVDDEL
jgi:hypothetical protein